MYSLSQKEEWNDGRYLILDAGKGTLDFSVLEYKASRLTTNPPFTCVYRSGFVGAGNTLTYALFLDILKETIQPYMKADDVLETKMEEWLVKYLDEGDEADWADLMTSVEKYKVELGRMVNPVSDSDDSGEYGLEDIDLSQLKSGLDKWMENNSKLTQTGYLDAMVRNLVVYTIDEIGYKGPLNYVIFAGRGFLFEPFRSAMLERIKSVPKWNGIEIKSLDSAGSSYTIKNMCLFASEMIAKGFYDGRRVGRPEVFKDSSKEPDQSQSPDSPSKGMREWIKGLGKKMLKRYVKFQKGAFTDFDKSGDNKKMEFDDYVHGRKLFIADTNSKVTISGASHYLPAWVRKGYIDVFFDGEEFVFRQKRRSSRFDPTPAPQDRFIAESTFPYTKLDRIPFPH